MKFHTGNEIETTDSKTEQWGGVGGVGGCSADDLLKEEVAKLMNKLTESATLQNRLVNYRLSDPHTKSEAV